MCPFVFLGGVRRHVPPGARLLVHQIWPKGETASPATPPPYTAQEWAGEQRVLGELARYTIDMGGDIGLFEAAMRVPPWEGVYLLASEDVLRFGLDNAKSVFKEPIILTSAKRADPPRAPIVASAPSDAKASPWRALERAGHPILAREYPLSSEGRQIGKFEISFACGGEDGYNATYTERRLIEDGSSIVVSAVGIGTGSEWAALEVRSSSRSDGQAILETQAYGTIAPGFISALTREGGRRLAVTTMGSDRTKTDTGIPPDGLVAAAQLMSTCQGNGAQAGLAPAIRGPR
jgi:hypothetical protein